jgi:hypothetical protein
MAHREYRMTAPASSPLHLQRSAAALARDDGRLGWAPIVAALAIDLADFATAGPLGLVAGLFVGGVLTTIVARASGAKRSHVLILALLGALYCAVPVTELLPLATMLTLVHGFLVRARASGEV